MRVALLCCFLLAHMASGVQLLLLSRLEADVSRYPRLLTALNAERAADAGAVVVASGQNIGSPDPISKLGREAPGTIALNGLGVAVTSLANHDFDQGLARLEELLVAWRPVVVAANVGRPLPRVAPYFVQTYEPGLTIGYTGIYTASSQSVTDQTIVRALNVSSDPLASLLEGRREAELAGANFFVALLDARISTLQEIDAFVAPFAPLFDIICLGMGYVDSNGGYQRMVNGTLVVGARARGGGYAKIDTATKTVTLVDVGSEVAENANAALELSVWSDLATCKGSAKVALLDTLLVARSTNDGVNGLRYCRTSENPLNTVFLRGMQSLSGAAIAVVNTGAIRDNLPSSFMPDPSAELVRPGPTATVDPFDTASGDCDTVSPFGNVLQVQNATSKELYNILLWTANGDSEPMVARQMEGAVLGLSYRITFRADLTQVVEDVRFTATGQPLNPELDNDAHLIALTSFISAGGDGFPVITSSQPKSLDITDRDVLCHQLEKVGEGGDEVITFDELLPFEVITTRIEKVCSDQDYLMELQKGTSAFISSNAWTSLPETNVSLACLELSMTALDPRDFTQLESSLTSVSTVLAPPNDFSVVLRADGLIVGQISGYPLNLSVTSSVEVLTGQLIEVVVCLPEARFIPVYGPFKRPGMVASTRNGKFTEAEEAPQVNFTVDGSDLATYCSSFLIEIGAGPVIIVPTRTLDTSSQFSVTEQVFLFLFGIVYLAFTCYAAVLLAHHIALTRAMIEDASLIDFINPAMVVRIELILVGLSRFLYFVLLPWGTLAVNVVGGYFLFEFPFILDFSIYSTFIQLFVTVFHWRKLRSIEKRYLWIPLLTVNVVLFAFFFGVLIAYGESDDPGVRSSLVLAYHIALASVAFLVVIAFSIYGSVLAMRVHKAVNAGNRPLWLPQMRRLTIVTALATLGILAIFIVIIYNSTRTVPDPVLSSTPWVICFLFFAELLPLFAILTDLYRTALVNQANLTSQEEQAEKSGGAPPLEDTESRKSSVSKRTLSFAVQLSRRGSNGAAHGRGAPRVPSGEVADVIAADSMFDPNLEKTFDASQVEI